MQKKYINQHNNNKKKEKEGKKQELRLMFGY